MAAYTVDRHNLSSCVEYDQNFREITFPTRFRDQRRIHCGSSMHHAACLVVEFEYRQRAKVLKSDEKVMVDIGMLIRNLPPPVSITTLFDYFKNNELKAETPGFVFQIKDYTVYHVGENPDDYDKAMELLRKGKVGFGMYSYTEECKPVPGQIFERDRSQMTGEAECPDCGSLIPMCHAVCITGVGWLQGKPLEVFEYIDSERPGMINYMTTKSMDTIVLAVLS